MDFKKGDIVELQIDFPDDNDELTSGITGIVVEESNDYTDWIGVQWNLDEPSDGFHDCGGAGEDGYCWRVDPDWIVRLTETEQVDIEVEFSELMEVLT